MVKGRERCTLQMNPADAARLGVEDGKPVKIASSAGEITAPAEITDDIREGVVSLPHGWGHDLPGIRLSVASEKAGVNSNVLTPSVVDTLSGNAVLNGIPVDVSA
jgi:anaerobic selenocysteine-containing dehydrogenase